MCACTTGRWMDWWIDGCMDEWVHGWIDRQIDSLVRLEPIRLARYIDRKIDQYGYLDRYIEVNWIDLIDCWIDGWIDG